MATKTKTRSTKHTGTEYDPTETNYTKLVFPPDPMGLTGKLRREFSDAVRRCRGDDEKFEQVLDALEILSAWADAKLAADRAENARAREMAKAKAKQAADAAVFRERLQAGPDIRVEAMDTEFVEVSRRNGSVLAVYSTADHPLGPIAGMAQKMLEEGRAPTSPLHVSIDGRPAIGSGSTLGQLVQMAEATTAAPEIKPGGLKAIKTN